MIKYFFENKPVVGMYYNGKLVNSAIYEWYYNLNRRTIFPPVLDVPQNVQQVFGCPNILTSSLCGAITIANLAYLSSSDTTVITAIELSKFTETSIDTLEFMPFPVDVVEASGKNLNVIPSKIFSYLPNTGYKAIASSRYANSDYDPFRAFDNSTSNKWVTQTADSTPSFLEYISLIPFSIEAYEITTVHSYITEQASEWTLSASTDGINYDLIHSVSGHGPYTQTNFKELFILPAKTSEYTHWKFDITDGSGSGRFGFGNINLTPNLIPEPVNVLSDIVYSDPAAGIGSSPTLGNVTFTAIAGSIDGVNAVDTNTTNSTIIDSNVDTIIQFDIPDGVTCDILVLTTADYTPEGIIEYEVLGSTDGNNFVQLYENLDFIPGGNEFYTLEKMFARTSYKSFRFRFKPRAGTSTCKINSIALFDSKG